MLYYYDWQTIKFDEISGKITFFTDVTELVQTVMGPSCQGVMQSPDNYQET